MQCVSIESYDERYTTDSWDFPNISRSFSIIYYVLGGSAYYTIDGVERAFEKGHLYIFPVNRIFSLRQDPNDKFYSVFIHAFTAPYIDSVINVDVKEDPFIERTLEFIRIYVKQRGKMYVRILTEMMLSYIVETLGEVEDPLPAKIKNYIDSNFVSVFGGEDLSQSFNYSKSHLSKLFREKYHLTPKQYAQQLMLKEISYQLYKGVSVADIAEKLEFSSPENLSRFFKSHYGSSPTDYRKRFKEYLNYAKER